MSKRIPLACLIASLGFALISWGIYLVEGSDNASRVFVILGAGFFFCGLIADVVIKNKSQTER